MKRKVIGAASLPLPYGSLACGKLSRHAGAALACGGAQTFMCPQGRGGLYAAGAKPANPQCGAESGVFRSDTFNAKTSML